LLQEEDDYTTARYRNDFQKPVFEDRRTITGTVSASANTDVRRPMLFRLHAGEGKDRRMVTLAFFDTAGEDLNDEDTMSIVNKYIYRSDGLILLIDPLQIGYVQSRVGAPPSPGEAGRSSVHSPATDILNRTTRLIQRGLSLGPEDPVPIPLAVAFSKFDALADLVDPQFQVNSLPDHRGGYDFEDFEAVNDEMRALLEDWGHRDLLQSVDMMYRRHGFFGLSALGCAPKSQQISRVLPHRVEDPFLWLLARHKILKPRRN
jgi:hypothetical protein